MEDRVNFHRDSETEADVAAGLLVSHEEVAKWLKSWGTRDELPCPIPKR
jgi:predicted transcriptional regulator